MEQQNQKTSCGCGHCHEKKESGLLLLAVGAVIFAVALVIYIVNGAKMSGNSLFIVLCALSYICLGFDVILIAFKNGLKLKFFDENFLMTIATIGAFAIGEYLEAGAVMLFFKIGEYMQERAVLRSRRSIEALMDIRPDSAILLDENANETVVDPSVVAVGDIIIVKPSQKIPLDGVVVDGGAFVDTRALTGESEPRRVESGSDVLSGCICLDGVIKIRVTKVFSQSTVSKILELVSDSAQKKSPTEKFITKFAKVYTPCVVVAAVLIATIPLLFGGAATYWIERGIMFLLISCPCALVVSIPLAYFAGLGAASREGILVKGANYLDALCDVSIAVFDKTGTLTKGEFEITAVECQSGVSVDELINAAAIAEAHSAHPIAKAIMRRADKGIKAVENYKEIAGQGVVASFGDDEICAGNLKLMQSKQIEFVESNAFGTKIYVSKNNRFLGCIIVGDSIRSDSKKTLVALKKFGVKSTVMLTGDNAQTADLVAKQLEIDRVYSELLPHQKVELAEKLAEEKGGGNLLFVGDGVNDAPVLARVDIGVAMGALGSDAAIEAADVVLMTDEPQKLISAGLIARKTKKTAIENIVFSLSIKAAVLAVSVVGILPMWGAVFADVGVALLAVLNCLKITKGRYRPL